MCAPGAKYDDQESKFLGSGTVRSGVIRIPQTQGRGTKGLKNPNK